MLRRKLRQTQSYNLHSCNIPHDKHNPQQLIHIRGLRVYPYPRVNPTGYPQVGSVRVKFSTSILVYVYPYALLPLTGRVSPLSVTVSNVTAFLEALSLHRFCWTCTPTTCQLHMGQLVARDGFKQAAAISCRFNNPISRKTGLPPKSHFSLFGPPSLLANDKYFNNSFPFRK